MSVSAELKTLKEGLEYFEKHTQDARVAYDKFQAILHSHQRTEARYRELHLAREKFYDAMRRLYRIKES